jgi:hypothetical protein
MIFHASLPADDPKFVAETLARMLGGEALPFPPGPNAWMAWSRDGQTELEITPRGFDLVKGADEVQWDEAPRAARTSDWHIALGTPLSRDEVLAIAREAGWPARICDRGGFFHVIEIYVEGAAFMEVLDEEMQAQYKASMSPANWRRVFGFPQAA